MIGPHDTFLPLLDRRRRLLAVGDPLAAVRLATAGGASADAMSAENARFGQAGRWITDQAGRVRVGPQISPANNSGPATQWTGTGTPLGWTRSRDSRSFRLRYSPRRAGGGRAFTAGSVAEVQVPFIQYPAGYGVNVAGARVLSRAGAPTLRLALCPRARQVSVFARSCRR